MYKYYFKIANSNDYTENKKGVIGIIYTLSFALAQLNCMPIKKGRRYLKDEIMSMKLIPDDFEEIYETAVKPG